MQIVTPNGAAPAAGTTDPALMDLKVATLRAKARAKAAADAKAAALEDPETKIAEARLSLAREEREALLAEHELATDAIYRAACLAHGEEMIARIPTRDGSIVLRAETEQEIDERVKLVGALERQASREVDGPRKAILEHDMEGQTRACFTKCILSDRAHFERVTTKFRSLWFVVGRAANDLGSGRVIAEGKGVGA